MSYLGRMLFLLLCLWSAHQAWAAVAFQKGEYAMERGDVSEAQRHFGQAIMQGFAWPDAAFDYAYTFFLQAMDSGDAALVEEAVQKMQTARGKLPLHAKSLVYEARLLLHKLELEGEITRTGWNAADALLNKAYDLKGANLWIPFQTAKVYLTHSDFSTREQKERSYADLQAACRLVPEYYLEPALVFLISRKAAPDWLAGWIPSDYQAAVLADSYFRRSGSWSYWKAFYPVFLELKKQEKQKRLILVAAAIQRGQPEKARELLLQTQWIDEDALDLKVYEGLLQFQTKRLGSIEKEQLVEDLVRFLESGKNLGGFTEFARVFIHSLRHDYLQGLYAYSQGDFKSAAAAFEKSDIKSSRKRFLHAQAYLQSGLREKAAQVLTVDLQQSYTDIDLRNLTLLEKINPALKEDIQALKEKNKVAYRPVSAWASGGGALRHGTDQGMLITLAPGEQDIFISARNLETAGFPTFVVVRLQGRYAGSFWIRSTQWRPFRIPVSTEGGRFWLSVQVMNHEGQEDTARLGEVRIGAAS